MKSVFYKWSVHSVGTDIMICDTLKKGACFALSQFFVVFRLECHQIVSYDDDKIKGFMCLRLKICFCDSTVENELLKLHLRNAFIT